jgi:hypothetical protein
VVLVLLASTTVLERMIKYLCKQMRGQYRMPGECPEDRSAPLVPIRAALWAHPVDDAQECIVEANVPLDTQHRNIHDNLDMRH